MSACLRSSPITRTVEVVPSPVMSSCAVEARAIREAVGCWICISWRRTLPSLVIFMSPAPETNLRKQEPTQTKHIYLVLTAKNEREVLDGFTRSSTVTNKQIRQ
ncbi:hypothetical protein GEV33_001814 [Tenebrio molitor]|uniref:Uncharacterized protein n=1 Tax=Tenebrio molitor TaxID=7067 RepID=A0A8J6HVC5_TENMO|nr:hypothetical protein GEV33_001814 [Tenebrio molitor]